VTDHAELMAARRDRKLALDAQRDAEHQRADLARLTSELVAAADALLDAIDDAAVAGARPEVIRLGAALRRFPRADTPAARRARIPRSGG
jgi:F0F1-type ATP synthase membrane subunit b/b'